MVQRTYVQSRNRDTDVENTYRHSGGGEGEWDVLGDFGLAYIHY